MFGFINSIMVAFAKFMTVYTTGMSIDDTFHGLDGIYQMAYVINTYEYWLDRAPLCIILIAVSIVFVAWLVGFVLSILTANDDDEKTESTVA